MKEGSRLAFWAVVLIFSIFVLVHLTQGFIHGHPVATAKLTVTAGPSVAPDVERDFQASCGSNHPRWIGGDQTTFYMVFPDPGTPFSCVITVWTGTTSKQYTVTAVHIPDTNTVIVAWPGVQIVHGGSELAS